MFKLVIISFIIACLIGIGAILTNTRFQDWINPKKWRSVAVALLKKLLKKLDNSEVYLEPHEVEQYHFRMLMCEPCVNNGKCLNCGCSTLEKMNIQKETCSKGRWGKFKNAEAWKQFKQDLKIEFKVFINNQESKDIDV